MAGKQILLVFFISFLTARKSTTGKKINSLSLVQCHDCE